MRTSQRAIALLCLTLATETLGQQPAPTQTVPQWRYVKDDDVLHDKVYDRFILDGVYLTPLRIVTTTPSIVIECSDGKVEQNYFDVGTVIVHAPNYTKLLFLEGRIDGKRTVFLNSGPSTDGQGMFFPRYDLTTVLKGKDVIVGAYEHLGAEVVMRFEVPDPPRLWINAGLIGPSNALYKQRRNRDT